MQKKSNFTVSTRRCCPGQGSQSQASSSGSCPEVFTSVSSAGTNTPRKCKNWLHVTAQARPPVLRLTEIVQVQPLIVRTESVAAAHEKRKLVQQAGCFRRLFLVVSLPRLLFSRRDFLLHDRSAPHSSNSSSSGRIKDKHLGDMRKCRRIGVLRLQNNTEKDSDVDVGAWRASD